MTGIGKDEKKGNRKGKGERRKGERGGERLKTATVEMTISPTLCRVGSASIGKRCALQRPYVMSK